MKVINVLTNKYVLIFLAFLISNICVYFYVKRQNTNDTQTLSNQEKQLEALNTELGLSHSQLTSQSSLNKQLADENDSLKKQLDTFVKNNKLKVISIDDSVIGVKENVKGNKIVSKPNCFNIVQNSNTQSINNIISYEWHDQYNRFQLKDNNIFNPNDEVLFTASQNFKIVGEIFKQKNGNLETRRMVLQEVVLGKDGKYMPIKEAQAKLVDSQFDYSEDDSKPIFHPRAIALFDSNKQLGLGAELFSFHNVGLNLHNSFDFTNLKQSSIRAGAAYNFNFDKIKTNVGLGASVGTEYQNFFHNYNFSLDLVFYLTE